MSVPTRVGRRGLAPACCAALLGAVTAAALHASQATPPQTAAVATTPSQLASAARTPSGAVSGRIVHADTGAPLVRAQVTLNAENTQRVVTTDREAVTHSRPCPTAGSR